MFPLYQVLHLRTMASSLFQNLLNISAGTTVTWTNGELTSYKSFEVEQLHTVTSGSLESRNIGIDFDSGFLAAGKTFQHTFVSTGTFDYF